MKLTTKALLGTLIMATALPVAITPAAAQSRGELRRDRQDIREEQRELNRAIRNGDRRDVREERRDVREAKREYREDLSDYRRYRASNRNAFRAGAFRSEYRYRSFRPGVKIGAGYYAPRYSLNNYNAYRLPRPGRYQRWVRNYNDVLLVNTRTGVVVRVIPGFFW